MFYIILKCLMNFFFFLRSCSLTMQSTRDISSRHLAAVPVKCASHTGKFFIDVATYLLTKERVVFEYAEKTFNLLPRNLELVLHLTRHEGIRIQKRVILLADCNI